LLKSIRNFPVLLLMVFIIAGLLYYFSYLFPFTSNAFVMANITPVAANVSGFITDVYVKNGQKVKKGDPLFKIFQEPYKYTYNKSNAEYKVSLAHLEELKNITAKNEALLKVAKSELSKVVYDYKLKNAPEVLDAVSSIDRHDLAYQKEVLANKVTVLEKQLKIDDSQIKQQLETINSLKAEVDLAKTNLDLTIVRAGNDGIVDNLYVSNGTQVSQNQPLFSFINTDDFYIQANFNETDLRNVKKGDNVSIIPRMYFGDKVYHGIVTSDVWSVNRQDTAVKNQLQVVTQSENNWILLPQRLPVQIKITDYDATKFPLSVGSTSYIYIHTHIRR
jgi:membrane fusion protein, multidrug efflux system